MNRGKRRRGAWGECNWYMAYWGFRGRSEKCIKNRMIWQTYLWAAVFASTTPAVCIHDRTGFMPLPSGSSFIVVPPLGIFSWIPNIKTVRVQPTSSQRDEMRVWARARRFSEKPLRIAVRVCLGFVEKRRRRRKKQSRLLLQSVLRWHHMNDSVRKDSQASPAACLDRWRSSRGRSEASRANIRDIRLVLIQLNISRNFLCLLLLLLMRMMMMVMMLLAWWHPITTASKKASGHCWIHHFWLQKTNKRVNDHRGGVPGHGRGWWGAFSASLQNGWKHTKLNPLSPRTGTFPGSQKLQTHGIHAVRGWRARRRGFAHTWRGLTLPVAGL